MAGQGPQIRGPFPRPCHRPHCHCCDLADARTAAPAGWQARFRADGKEFLESLDNEADAEALG